MKKVKKEHFETILSAVAGSLGCWLIIFTIGRISEHFAFPMWLQAILILIVWPFASYKLIVAAPKIISRLLNNRRAAQGGEPPKRYDYRKEIDNEAARKGGKCRGFMRLVILEKGAWADGEYEKADLIYGIARVMIENPHFAVEMQTAMLCYQMMARGHVSQDIIATIVHSAAQNCPCDHCKAEREVKQREATNN